jgi:hypothetical protein
MAMLRALRCVKLGKFTPMPMCNEKLDLAIASAAFHVEQVAGSRPCTSATASCHTSRMLACFL